MTTATTTPQAKVTQAAEILRRVSETTWPPGREAQSSIGWALGEVHDAMAERSAVLSGELDPNDLGEPDSAWWEDPDTMADETTADRVLDRAKALERRLAEYQRRAAA